jgi:hypothetical protein
MPAPGPGPAGTWLGRGWRTPTAYAFQIALGLSLLYIVTGVRAPDLAAQIARSQAAAHGATVWWGGWYGGVNLLTYSVVSGPLMRDLGVTTVGVAATVAVAAAAGELLRGSARPRAGAIAAGAAAAANLFSGRVTFALGMAVALAALVLLRRRQPIPAALVAAASGATSPVAGLFACLAVAGVAVVTPAARRSAVAVGAATVIPMLATAALFGQPSIMPFSAASFVPTIVLCIAVALMPAPRQLRVGALLAAVVALIAFVAPTPIGSNASRVPMLAAAPLAIAYLRGPALKAALVAGALAIVPVTNLVHDLLPAGDASASAAYYAPLRAHLPRTGTATQRLEVVDPRSHGADSYLPRQIPLARGWERQLDVASNPIFYDGGLTAATYLAWLRDRGVGWVALPDAKIDWGAVSERALVAAGLPYLREVWHSPHWRLFRVTVPAPMARGVARVTGLTDQAVRLRADRAGPTDISVAYSRVLALTDGSGDTAGCVSRAPDGNVRVVVPGPGSYELQGRLTALADRAARCGPDGS